MNTGARHHPTLWLLAVAVASSSFGQFTSLVTNFEEPGWTPFVTQVMFRDPTLSGSTVGLDPADGQLTYLTDVTQDTFSTAHGGTRAAATFWGWRNPGDSTSWVRLVTFNATQIPNPAVHLGGKVRMWIAAKAYTNGLFTTRVNGGRLLLGIGVRETGEGVRLGGNGGVSGDIEWVGLTAKRTEILGGVNAVCDTTANPASDDIQVTAVGAAAGAGVICVAPGPDAILQTAAAGDDVIMTTPMGMHTIQADGVMREYVFDLPALQTAGRVYSFSGDGVLGATPSNRGTLEHLTLTNDPVNAGVNAKVFLVNIDDVTFEAPIVDPPTIRTQPTPPRPLDESVAIDAVNATATSVQLVRIESDSSLTPMGSVNPAGAATVNIATSPLPANIRLAARQVIGGNTSDLSTPALVTASGNGPLRIAMAIRETDQYDHGLSCGGDGTGFDPDQPSSLEFIGSGPQDGFGVPSPPRFTPSANWMEITFNPCDPTYGVAIFSGNGVLNLRPAPDFTNGVWEGLYFRIDDVNPSSGPFTVYIDDLAVKRSDGTLVCLIDDFEGYTPGEFIVGDVGGNGQADTTAEATDVQVVSPGSTTFPGQIIVGPGADGTLETVPGGDDLLSSRHARFNNPGVAGTSVGLASAPDVAEISIVEAFSGTKSLKIEWGFTESSNLRSTLRLTTNGSLATNPPETFLNPDSVIPLSLDGGPCDGVNDLVYSVRIKLPPPTIPGDGDGDGDVDIRDIAYLQRCFGVSPVIGTCSQFNIAPNGAPDLQVNFADFELLTYLFAGPLP